MRIVKVLLSFAKGHPNLIMAADYSCGQLGGSDDLLSLVRPKWEAYYGDSRKGYSHRRQSPSPVRISFLTAEIIASSGKLLAPGSVKTSLQFCLPST
jgi:hypothetical protein